VIFEWIQCLEEQWFEQLLDKCNKNINREDKTHVEELKDEMKSQELSKMNDDMISHPKKALFIGEKQLCLTSGMEVSCGSPVTDRKSTFQAFLSRVQSVDEVNSVVNELKLDNKIARATHNMVAYRIAFGTAKSTTTIEEGRCDDGEHGGGDKILAVLRAMNAVNVVVMVTRWYGGIHLGPDRFKHIGHVTRQIVEENGIPNEENITGHSNGMFKPPTKNIEIGKSIVHSLLQDQSNSDNWTSQFELEVCNTSKDGQFQLQKIDLKHAQKILKKISWVQSITFKGALVWHVRTLCGSYQSLKDLCQTK